MTTVADVLGTWHWFDIWYVNFNNSMAFWIILEPLTFISEKLCHTNQILDNKSMLS